MREVSLTPNEDRTRAALEEQAADAAGKIPGTSAEDAAKVRIVQALTEAYALAIAREYDRGTPREVIEDGAATAAAQIVAGVALAYEKPGCILVGHQLAATVALRIGRIVGAMASGGIRGASVPIEPVVRA